MPIDYYNNVDTPGSRRGSVGGNQYTPARDRDRQSQEASSFVGQLFSGAHPGQPGQRSTAPNNSTGAYYSDPNAPAQNRVSSGGSNYNYVDTGNVPPGRPRAYSGTAQTGTYVDVSAQPNSIPPRPPARGPVIGLRGTDRTTVQSGSSGSVRELQKIYEGLGHNALTEDLANDVDYLKRSDREQYLITVKDKLYRGRQLFDTKKTNDAVKASGQKPARFGGGGSLPEIWKGSTCIWICTSNAQDRAIFYSHVCVAQKFHHSTFIGGASVIGAGEWVVKDGVLLSVSGNSGHYRPEMRILYNSVLHMTKAVNAETTVLLWDVLNANWTLRRFPDFIAKPTDNGRYKVSPHSAA